jgi:hypothetical protein
MASLLEQIVQKNAIDRALMIKNDRMGRVARPRENVAKKNMTGIDEELLKEYQERTPQSFEYIDKNGEKKNIRYLLPNSKPDLIATIQNPMTQKDIDGELKILDDEKQDLLIDLKSIKRTHKLYTAQIPITEDLLNNSSTTEDIRKNNIALTNLRDDLQVINKEINRITQNIQDIETQKENVKQKFINQKETIAKIDKTNLDLVNQYRDTLNFLNQGAFSTEKAQDESEMEYLERLQKNAEIESPENQLEDAKFLTITKFREKMRELIRDPVKIEQVINSLDKFEDVDNKAILLKNWTLVKSKFIQTYGENNKTVTSSDILNFFQYFLEVGDSGLSKAVESQFSQNELPINNVGLSVEALPSEDTLIIKHQTALEEKKLFLRAITDNSNTFLIYSFTGNKGSYKQYFDADLPSDRSNSGVKGKSGKSSVDISSNTGITSQKLNSIFGINSSTINQSLISKKMFSMFKINSISRDRMDVIEKDYTTIPNRYGKTKEGTQYGMGLHAEKMPIRATFGDVYILPRKLYYNNELSVKNAQDKSIAGFRTTKVSETFVKLIMNMLNGLEPTHTDLNQLSNPERQLYDRLIQLAHLNKNMPNHGDKTIAELKKRLKLVEAEIQIGNDNPMLVKEIYGILHSLKDFKVITQGQINSYMKQLK